MNSEHSDYGSERLKIIAVSLVMLAVSTVSTFLRLISRWQMRQTRDTFLRDLRTAFWWDDYLILVAMVLSWPFNISDLAGRWTSLDRSYNGFVTRVG